MICAAFYQAANINHIFEFQNFLKIKITIQPANRYLSYQLHKLQHRNDSFDTAVYDRTQCGLRILTCFKLTRYFLFYFEIPYSSLRTIIIWQEFLVLKKPEQRLSVCFHRVFKNQGFQSIVFV